MLELAQRVDVAALGLADADLDHLCMGKMGRHRHHGDAARYQLRRAPAAGALGFKRDRQDRGVPATADYAGIRCRFGRPRPLNPFAACRDQRTNGRKGRNGITRGKPQHSAGGFIPGTKTVVIGACAPIHPRVGPAVRPDVSIRGGPLFLLRNSAF